MSKKQYLVREKTEETIKYKGQNKKVMTNSKKIVQTSGSSSSTANFEPRTSNSFLPTSFRKYFWDCPFNGLSLEKYPRFVAARILDFGDWEAVSWLFTHGGRDLVDKTAKNQRYVNRKTENFWKIILHG